MPPFIKIIRRSLPYIAKASKKSYNVQKRKIHATPPGGDNDIWLVSAFFISWGVYMISRRSGRGGSGNNPIQINRP
jgi:hypothetical protein